MCGRHREAEVQDRPGKAFLVRDARPQCRRSTMQNGGGGPLRNFLFGDDGSGVRRTTGRVSVSSEAEAEKLLLNPNFRIPDCCEGGNPV